jgi:hypothetical protein
MSDGSIFCLTNHHSSGWLTAADFSPYAFFILVIIKVEGWLTSKVGERNNRRTPGGATFYEGSISAIYFLFSDS